ncbi:MAG: VOC family protein [Paracraurococcus sp.]
MTTPPPEPIMDVAHLGHVELLTPRPEASMRFFTEVMGLTESGRQGDSVFLRGWDDYERYSLVLTGASTSGLGHAAFRARSPQALDRRIAALRADGVAVERHEDSLGHGPAWRFHDPAGHLIELYFDTEWYEAPPERRPALKNQAERYPARGVNVRRLDHFNTLGPDVRAAREFYQRNLGLRCTERIELDNGLETGMWLTATNKSYGMAMGREPNGIPGRLHHITFALDSREAILQAADVFLDAGIAIENGPHKHAIQQTFFLYVYEPGGNRVELAHAGARLVLAPDWRTITWTEAERNRGQAWGLQLSESFRSYATPPGK